VLERSTSVLLSFVKQAILNEVFMKKNLLVLAICFSVFCSCKSKEADYMGSWKGDVLIVYVEYVFQKDSFISATYSLNNVMIGGSKGKMTVKDGVMQINEEERYNYNSDTNKGRWDKNSDKYAIEYKVSGDSLTLKPETSKESITLDRQK
jgi:hypothetical protein